MATDLQNVENDREVTEIVTRFARPADIPHMLDLTRVALGEGSLLRTESFWNWKHNLNPFGPSPAMVAEVGGRIVSLRVFLRWRWICGQHAYPAMRPVDTATHPSWRRRGLFERLTRELVQAVRDQDAVFLFNTPNARSGRGYQKLGWRIVGRPTIWVRPRKPIPLLRLLTRPREADRAEKSVLPATGTSTELLSSPDLGSFLARIPRTTSSLMTDVDNTYLAWRYRDCPELAYNAAGAFDRRSGALIITRHTVRRGLRELRICDFFAGNDRSSRDQARETIRALLRESDADCVTACAARGTVHSDALLRCGFVPIPRIGPDLAVRPLIEPRVLPAIHRLSAWGASIGDLEVF